MLARSKQGLRIQQAQPDIDVVYRGLTGTKRHALLEQT